MSSAEPTDKKYFKVTTSGTQKLKDLELNKVEADAVLMAIQGTLGTEINKRGKITKKVLCEALTKVVKIGYGSILYFCSPNERKYRSNSISSNIFIVHDANSPLTT